MRYVVFTSSIVYGTYNSEAEALAAAKAFVLEMDPNKFRPDQVWLAKTMCTTKRSATTEAT